MLTVGDLFGLKDGDNPHRWYDPADVEAVANAITADLQKLDPKNADYFDQRLTTFETTRPRRLPPADRADQAPLRRHCRSAPRRASSRCRRRRSASKLITPARLHEGDQRGHRGRPPRTRSPPQRQIARPARSRCGSTTPRTRRRRSSGSTRSPASSRIPVATMTETPDPRRRELRAVAGGAARADRAARCMRPPDDELRQLPRLRRAAGRPRIFAGVESAPLGRGEFVAVLGPNGAGKSTLMRAILGLVPLAAGCGHRARPAARRRRAARIGYLPQRRGLRSQRRACAASTSCDSALDGARWGVPIPLRPPRAGGAAPSAPASTR